MDEPTIAFLDTKQFENGKCIRGAVLVTDCATGPLEFRCTSPIRPTTLQTVLWGGRLTAHVATKLVGKPLVESLNNKCSIIIVRKPEFIELRPLVELPLIQLLRQEELAMASELASDGDDDDTLASPTQRFEPVVLKVHRRFPDDRGAAKELLADTFSSHNILEPFERISTALDIVHEQESGKPGR